MTDYSMEFKGAKEISKAFAKYGREAVPAMAAGLTAAAHLMMLQSQAEVPFRYGVLKSSGRVFEPEILGTLVTVDMGYGGAASDYAFYVHERDQLHFGNGKKAHYLSDPVSQGAATVGALIAARLKGVIG